MDWVSAPYIAEPALQTRSSWAQQIGAALERLDALLESERDQLPLWLVVAFGCGIAGWLSLGQPRHWQGAMCLAAASVIAGLLFRHRRSGQVLAWGSAAVLAGCALIWARAEWVSGPRVERPVVVTFSARVERVEQLVSRGTHRLTLAPVDASLPARVRVSIPDRAGAQGISAGALISLRARLVPPPPMALPGSHDHARDAWFRGIGGTGRALDPPTIIEAGTPGWLDNLREGLGSRIRERLPESSGAIATALANGDQGAISEADAEAMRRSGLAHLLSVSGLHIAAAVGGAMFLALRLLAISERLALRFNLVVVSAGAGAAAGIAYTLLTGAQVPTVRSCIAALLVLLGLALGREAFSIRLVAVGALVVLLFRPEALAGASFQLSFAAVTAIVVLHEQGWMKRWFGARDQGMLDRATRAIGTMVLTGLAVELALIPFALFHFHKAGLYGVAANIIAIPLTTFVIMPLEALALIVDPIGIAGPLWWLTGLMIDGLLSLARSVAAMPGSVIMTPAIPNWAFAAMVGGGLWFCLWKRRWRVLGIVPIAVGALGAATTSAPDLVVTGDGRHLAVITDGKPALLRERSGDFMRSLIGEAAGFDGEAGPIAALRNARCSRDSCMARITRDGRSWTLLATRSNSYPDWNVMVRACAMADIVVSDRRLPRYCRPRWLKLDREALKSAGGLAIHLGSSPRIDSVAQRVGQHPWAATSGPP